MNASAIEAFTTSRGPARGQALRLHARAALAVGQHEAALDALRRAQRLKQVDWPSLVLAEADALLRLERYTEALQVVGRGLRRQPVEPDLEARLRLLRGEALWRLGRVAGGQAEVKRGAALAQEPSTRARACEVQGMLAWKAQNVDEALRYLAEARQLHQEAASVDGVLRVLQHECAVLWDEGRERDALAKALRRADLAAATTRFDVRALAHRDAGALLAALGRWAEARVELGHAGDLFRRISDPREITLVGLTAARLDLAAGQPHDARRSLERVRAAHATGVGDTHSRGDAFLLWADLQLALGEAAQADEAAVQALQIFSSAHDGIGTVRARLRRVHALLALGRTADALHEGRRAARAAKASRKLRPIAEATLARALLRAGRSEAAPLFARLARTCTDRPWLAAAARLGCLVAAGVGSETEEFRAPLNTLEDWGDRWLTALCLSDVPSTTTAIPTAASVPLEARAMSTPELAALGAAARALNRTAGGSEGIVEALRAVRSVVAWRRIAFVHDTQPGWLMCDGEDELEVLDAADLARRLARDCRTPVMLDLESDSRSVHDSQRVAHGLRHAFLVPVEGAGVLYVDSACGEGLNTDAQALLAEVAGLLGLCPGDRPRTDTVDEEGPTFAGIVGRSEPMRALFRQMTSVAASEVPVHVHGETGAGKERIARALHEHSRRKQGPFVAVNASALSDELFEAELFGHTRGAFTGAIAERTGLVAEAEGGTLFLDEVADLSLRAQAKLLRFLQEREYRRVGESHTRRANIRVVSAANKDLADLVTQGAFRLDLLYRLNTVVLQLPSLRERPEDILPLARHFLRLAAARDQRQCPALSPDVTQRLQTYAWPGNIRELENEMSRAVALAGAGAVVPGHLSAHVQAPCAAPIPTLRAAQARWEREFVAHALALHGGSRVRTANALGITRQALLEKGKRLGL